MVLSKVLLGQTYCKKNTLIQIFKKHLNTKKPKQDKMNRTFSCYLAIKLSSAVFLVVFLSSYFYCVHCLYIVL